MYNPTNISYELVFLIVVALGPRIHTHFFFLMQLGKNQPQNSATVLAEVNNLQTSKQGYCVSLLLCSGL